MHLPPARFDTRPRSLFQTILLGRFRIYKQLWFGVWQGKTRLATGANFTGKSLSAVLRQKHLVQIDVRFELVAGARVQSALHAAYKIHILSINMKTIGVENRFVANMQHHNATQD